MSNWESTFARWSTPPSQSEQEKCENAINQIRRAIQSFEPFRGKHIKPFIQGSYRNRVNVRSDSDVDVGVICSDIFHAEYPEGMTDGDFGNRNADYSYAQFKNELEAALVIQFGKAAVSRGNKAFEVHENSYRVNADVVPLIEYRRYWQSGTYRAGVAIRPDNGGLILNFPERLFSYWPSTPLHYENGISKNDRTGRAFKGCVRIIKCLKGEIALPHRGGPPVLLVRRFPRSGVHAATSAQYGGMNAAGKMVCGAGGR